MSKRGSRAARRAAVASLVFASIVASGLARGREQAQGRAARSAEQVKVTREARSRSVHSPSPVTLRFEGGELLAFAPAPSAAPMKVVYLHGAHGRADKGCPWIRPGASEVGWLVCPEALEAEPNGVWSWGADVFAQAAVVARALRAAEAAGASRGPGVAVGFSQGSYVALDLVKARLATFRGLVLLGAELHPNVDRLRAAGVARVALGAGSHDAAYGSMKEEARRMQAEGLDARFFDLGAVGHTYAAEDTGSLRAAVAWAGGA